MRKPRNGTSRIAAIAGTVRVTWPTTTARDVSALSIVRRSIAPRVSVVHSPVTKSHYKRAPLWSRLSSLRTTTYERSTLNDRSKVYWARCSSSNDLRGGDGFQGQGCHGIHPGNASSNHPGVLRGTARNFVGHFRRRHVGCLALRSAQAACCQVSSVQPAQERAAQTWQQKRQDRCPQTCRSVASQ